VTDSPPGFDLAQTDRLLTTTRTVRKRLDLERPVDLDVVLDCLRLATQAPTGSNAQNWRFLVVTDPGKRAALGEIYREAGAAYAEAIGANAVSASPADPVQDSAAHLREVMGQVPVLVLFCQVGRAGSIREAVTRSGSIHPAAWSFMLALRSRGLGAAWTSISVFKGKEVADLLGIPDDVTQAVLMPVAWTIGTDFKPAARRPVEEVTFLDTWGAPVRPQHEG
jgi:nitroreductase